MKRLPLVFVVALGAGVATLLAATPEVRAHGAACGWACVDADGMGTADDMATCIEEMDTDPSDGICGCIRVPGHFPEGGEPVYGFLGEDHLNAVGISGYADESGPNGCIDVNGEAGVYDSEGNTDLAGCRETAGLACYENGCAVIELDSPRCGGDRDCSHPEDPRDADGNPCTD